MKLPKFKPPTRPELVGVDDKGDLIFEEVPVVPDSIEPVFGWKGISLIDGIPRSSVEPFSWFPGEVHEAKCRNIQEHKDVPVDNCKCGFHILRSIVVENKPRGNYYFQSAFSPTKTYMAVLGFGKVVEHSDGWRTQYATPVGFIYTNDDGRVLSRYKNAIYSENLTTPIRIAQDIIKETVKNEVADGSWKSPKNVLHRDDKPARYGTIADRDAAIERQREERANRDNAEKAASHQRSSGCGDPTCKLCYGKYSGQDIRYASDPRNVFLPDPFGSTLPLPPSIFDKTNKEAQEQLEKAYQNMLDILSKKYGQK